MHLYERAGFVEVEPFNNEPYARKGYATEGVARVCAWGLERFSLPAIVGVTDEENVASQRVLIRCGFSRKEGKMMRLQGVDRPAIIFEIRKKEA